MAKSELEKKFTAWERKQATATESSKTAKWFIETADKYEAEGSTAYANHYHKMAKSELKKANAYQAEADALYTDDVKKEHEARLNFLDTFASFINEWTIRFTNIEEEEFNTRKAANNAMWDELEAAGISNYSLYERTDIAKTYKEKYGKEVICSRIEHEFDREQAMANMKNCVTYEVLAMRYRVVEYVGTPTAIQYDNWSNGGLEGVVIGTDGKCYLRSIFAGGYNIQCLHIRMIVTKLS